MYAATSKKITYARKSMRTWIWEEQSNQNKICTIEINDHRFTIAKFIKASDPILDINYNNIRKYNILSQLQEEITTKHNSQYHYIQKQTFPILNHTAREIPTAKQYSLTSKSTINQHNDINFSNKQFYTNRTVNASPLKPGKGYFRNRSARITSQQSFPRYTILGYVCISTGTS